jgi:hypothetical protein
MGSGESETKSILRANICEKPKVITKTTKYAVAIKMGILIFSM